MTQSALHRVCRPAAAGLVVCLCLAGPGRLAAQTPGAAAPSPAAATAYASAAALQDRGLFDLAADDWRTLIKEFGDDPIAPRARYNLGVCLFQSADYAAAAEQFAAVADPQAHPEIAEQGLMNLGLARFNAAQTGGTTANPIATAERLSEALDAFDQLLEAYPKGAQAPAAWYYRGEALALAGKPGDAVEAYRRLIARFPESPLRPAALLGGGEALVAAGEPAAAEPVLTELIGLGEATSLLGRGYYARGDARLAAGRFADAAADFALAAQNDSTNAAEATQRQAYALFRAGDHAAAMKAYDQLASRWPKSPLVGPARLSAAKCLITVGRNEAAAERLQAIWSEDSTAANAPAAHWLVRSLLAIGDAAQAQSVANAAIATGPDPTWASELRLDFADALDAQGKPSEALAAYTAVAKDFAGEPIAARAGALAARAALERGDAGRALELAAAALQSGVDDALVPDLRQVVAEATRLTGDSAEAAVLYRQLIEAFSSDPHRAAWQVRLAACLGDEKQWGDVAALLSPMPPGLADDDFVTASQWLYRSRQQLGDLDEATAALTALLDRLPNHPAAPQAWYDRGRLLVQQGRVDKAEADFRQLIKRHADHPLAGYARFALATNQFNRQDYATAAETLRPFLANDAPEPAGKARFLFATVQLERGEYRAALDAIAGAKASPAEKLYVQGVCESRLGRIRQCRETLAKCLEAEGAAAVADRALYELAWVQDGEDLKDKAAALFARLADEHPGSPLAAEASYRVGEHRYATKDYEAAAARLQVAAASTEDVALAEKATHLLGWTRFDQKQYESATRVFLQQLEGFPEGQLAADARLMIGECQFAQEKLDEAIGTYYAALGDELLRDDLRPLGVLHLGQALGQKEAWRDAFDVLKPAAESAGDSPYAAETKYELAWALHKLGRSDEARPLLAEVADAASGALSARARFVLGELQFAAGEHEQAVRTFFKVAYGYGGREAPAAVHAWQSQSLFEAARCLEQLDRRGPALKLYAEVIERFPDSEKASHARRRLQGEAGA